MNTNVHMNEAILHDTQHAWLGALEKLTAYGCEMRGKADEETVGPHAQNRAQLLLQVLNEDESETQERPVELEGIRRAGEFWIYRLSWVEAA